MSTARAARRRPPGRRPAPPPGRVPRTLLRRCRRDPGRTDRRSRRHAQPGREVAMASHHANAVGWLWLLSTPDPGRRGRRTTPRRPSTTSRKSSPTPSCGSSPSEGGQTRDARQHHRRVRPNWSSRSPTASQVDRPRPQAGRLRAGRALEYVVFAIDPDEVYWHVRQGDRLVRIPPDPDGLYRSTAFPGLWLDPAAFLADDGPAIVATLERGLATAEHAAFVARLAAVQALIEISASRGLDSMTANSCARLARRPPGPGRRAGQPVGEPTGPGGPRLPRQAPDAGRRSASSRASSPTTARAAEARPLRGGLPRRATGRR